MANTTNYNWETPDDTDLVKDGAAAIRTLGSSIDTTTKALNPSTTLGDIEYRSSTANTNTRLAIGSNGQILGVSAGVPAWINNDQGDITEVQAGTGISVASGTGPIPTISINTATTVDLSTAQTLTNKTLTSPVLTTPTISTIDAKGDLLVGSADNTIARLAVGTNNHVLTADSTATNGVKWAAAAGGGKVLQVVQATNATEKSISSTTFTDSNLTGSITPTSASSKILVMVSQNTQVKGDASNVGGSTRLMRDSTAVYSIDANGYNALYGNFTTMSSPLSGSFIAMITYSYLDSPATTSSVTYKTQSKIFSTAASRAIVHQVESVQSNLILIEIGA